MGTTHALELGTPEALELGRCNPLIKITCCAYERSQNSSCEGRFLGTLSGGKATKEEAHAVPNTFSLYIIFCREMGFTH